MANYKLGEDAKLYYSATPITTTTVTATLTADNVKDVKVTAAHDAPEYTTRNNNGVKQYAVSLSDFGISFEIKIPGVGQTDAAYTAFQTAFKNKTPIQAAALTGAIATAGVEGPAGNWVVSKFEDDQSNGKPLFKSVELKPDSYNSYMVVSGS